MTQTKERIIVGDLLIKVEEFREVALDKLKFLEHFGFRRAPNLEETASTYGTVVFLGKHVGFTFSLDIRDQCVDASVFKVCNAQMKRNWEGGYSSNIHGYLVDYAGYRGGLPLSEEQKKQPPLERMVDGWAELLKQFGQKLLSDRPDSLPQKRGQV